MFNLGILLTGREQRGVPHQQQLAFDHEGDGLRLLYHRLHRRLREIEGDYREITVLFGDQVILQKGRKFIHPELFTAVQHIERRNFPLSDVFGRRFGIHPATSFSFQVSDYCNKKREAYKVLYLRKNGATSAAMA
ncbi:hypothetical protein D3C73_1110130 [compost metagenome]